MRKFIPELFSFALLAFMLFLIRPALLGQLNGLFKQTIIPHEYIKLENFLHKQKEFSRTFWVPTTQRLGFYSPVHPEVSAYDYFKVNDPESVVKALGGKNMEDALRGISIKYIIIPYDLSGEIFVTDRKYDNNKYLKTISQVRKIKWLKQISGFGRISIFEISNPLGHFSSDKADLFIKYNYVNPSEYMLELGNVRSGDTLMFLETFDHNWQAEGPGFKVKSLRSQNNLNNFILPKSGGYYLKIYYLPQKLVDFGSIISLASLIGVTFFIFARVKKK